MANYRITGFPVPSDVDIGPGQRGFALAESELGIHANIDPYFCGGLNFSIHPDDTASAKEAFSIGVLGYASGPARSATFDLPSGAVVVWMLATCAFAFAWVGGLALKRR